MIFDLPEYDNHQSIHVFADCHTGLRAIIALHRTGIRAGGGVRMMRYESDEGAMRDALKLSRAMTYKWALAGIPQLGGGKTVIIGDPRNDKTPELLHAFGKAVNLLAGQYVCGSDVGTNSADMGRIAEVTSYVRGVPGAGGDTSPPTGIGVHWAIRAAVAHKFRTNSLAGIRVAIQGAGGVGSSLARRLREEGASLVIADVDPKAAERLAAETGAKIASPDQVTALEVDVLAPCALGGTLRVDTVPSIKAEIVCGGANNQLGDPEAVELLAEQGTLYVPDYVANAGGIIAARLHGPDYCEEQAMRAVHAIYDTTREVLRLADARGVSPHAAAEELGRQRIAAYEEERAR